MTAAGFIGLGNMGGAVARRLLGTGVTLYVHDIRPEAVRALVAAGAKAAGPGEMAAACDTVVLSLPRHVEVDEVCLGRSGVLAAAWPGSLLVNLTTGSPAAAGRLAQDAAGCGVRCVSAPVSQGTDAARAGRLTAFAAGDDESYALAVPLLGRFCSQVIRLPSHEAAMAAKIVTNELWAVHVAALASAAAALVVAGVGAGDVEAVVTGSCGGSWAAAHDLRSVPWLDGDCPRGPYDESFTAGMMGKDLRLAGEVSCLTGVRSPVAAAAHLVWRRVLDEFGPDAPELVPFLAAAVDAGLVAGEPAGVMAGGGGGFPAG